MSKSCSRLSGFPADLNSKPAFCVGEILVNRRFDFYQVVRSDHRGAIVHQLASRSDNTPRVYPIGNGRVCVAVGFELPIPDKFRRDKRSRRVTNGFRHWDGRALPGTFNLEASGLS